MKFEGKNVKDSKDGNFCVSICDKGVMKEYLITTEEHSLLSMLVDGSGCVIGEIESKKDIVKSLYFNGMIMIDHRTGKIAVSRVVAKAFKTSVLREKIKAQICEKLKELSLCGENVLRECVAVLRIQKLLLCRS